MSASRASPASRVWRAVTASSGTGRFLAGISRRQGRTADRRRPYRPMPAADRCGTVTPPARHSASLPFERRDARGAAVVRRSGTFDDSQLWLADPVLHAHVSERCRLSPAHLSGIVQGSATSAVSAGLAAEPAPGPPLRWPPGCSFRAVCRGGSRRLSAGTTLVPDDGYRLLLGEPGAAENA
jgi:hypothetical protein